MLLSVPLQFMGLGTFPETSAPQWRWQCPVTPLLDSVKSFNPGEEAVLTSRQWASSTKRNLDVKRNKTLLFILYDRNCPYQKTKSFSVRFTVTLLQTHTCHFQLTSMKLNLKISCVISFFPFSSLNRRTRDLLVKWTISLMKSGTIFCYLTDGDPRRSHAPVSTRVQGIGCRTPAHTHCSGVGGAGTKHQCPGKELCSVPRCKEWFWGTQTIRNSTGYVWKVYILPYPSFTILNFPFYPVVHWISRWQ